MKTLHQTDNHSFIEFDVLNNQTDQQIAISIGQHFQNALSKEQYHPLFAKVGHIIMVYTHSDDVVANLFVSRTDLDEYKMADGFVAGPRNKPVENAQLIIDCHEFLTYFYGFDTDNSLKALTFYGNEQTWKPFYLKTLNLLPNE